MVGRLAIRGNASECRFRIVFNWGLDSMSIIDRYILRLFIKIFLICFVSFAGLFIVVDIFSNLEEIMTLSEREGGLFWTVVGYYGPRALQIFDGMAPLLALVASIFALFLMQQGNELIAIQAGGISNRRVARPIFIATALVLIFSAVNREYWLPLFRVELAMNAQDLTGGGNHVMTFATDPETGTQMRAKNVKPFEQVVEGVEFTFAESLPVYGKQLKAEIGQFLIEDEHHPPGYLVSKLVAAPKERTTSVDSLGQEVVLGPDSEDWLEPGQFFVCVGLDARELALGDKLARFAPLSEMVARSRQPSLSYSNRSRVDIHQRIVQPFFDFSILLIGLPIVISRRERGLLMSVGLCVGLVVSMLLVTIAAQAMGASRMITPPALAAWLPLIIFVPLTLVTFRLLDR